MAEALVVATAAAACAGPDSLVTITTDEFNSTSALVSYLRMEADMAEEKARRLRLQVAAMAQQFGISETTQDAYELDPGQMPPLDENGVPKYKGKKRGRKPKPRKRKANPNRRKRQHTGYTLYMKENYPSIKEANPDFPSKEIIGMLAKQWAEVLPTEKAEWKARAVATHNETDGADGEVAAAAAAAAAVEEVEEEDDDDEEAEEDEEPAPPARKSRRSKK